MIATLRAGATPYTRSFFSNLADVSNASAEKVVPVLLDLVRPARVIDVGCGTGGWLAVFKRLGVERIMGVDGDYVDRGQLQIPTECFSGQNLTEGVRHQEQFDLAVSLEVGEHLPERAARPFVESLTKLAPVVAFSAAVPGQGGVAHVNEQWQDYWAEVFAGHGYVVVDAVRPRVWKESGVAWYYRQNLLLYVRKEVLGAYPLLQRMREQMGGQPLSILHPAMYEGLCFSKRPENMPVLTAFKVFVASLKAALCRRLEKVILL